MDYIWLIRDSLSANNAIYFQFTVGLVCGFFFFVKPSAFPQTMKDFSEKLILLTPSCMGRTQFFMGWTINSGCYSLISNFAMFPRG